VPALSRRLLAEFVGKPADLIRDLVLFAQESVVVPRMRAAREALRALLPDIEDRDIALHAGVILNFADALFSHDPRRERRALDRL
jgi:hypothetical protein